jgi:hypothetical protein
VTPGGGECRLHGALGATHDGSGFRDGQVSEVIAVHCQSLAARKTSDGAMKVYFVVQLGIERLGDDNNASDTPLDLERLMGSNGQEPGRHRAFRLVVLLPRAPGLQKCVLNDVVTLVDTRESRRDPAHLVHVRLDSLVEDTDIIGRAINSRVRHE